MRIDIHNTSFSAPLTDHFQLSGNPDLDAGAPPEFSLPVDMIDVVSSVAANEFGILASFLKKPEVFNALPPTNADLTPQEWQIQTAKAANIVLQDPADSGLRTVGNLAQITGKNSLFRSNVNYIRGIKFVTVCYELAYIRCEITVEEYCVFSPDFDNTLDSTTNSISAEKQVFHENRPDIRHQWSISSHLCNMYRNWMHRYIWDCRYYMNNWTINSHTFEFSWFQPIDRVMKPNFAATHKAMPILLFILPMLLRQTSSVIF
ncbi:MAG TPA: hypothetical protein DEF07_03245 [Nitrosomonas sp.]|nr:hypothetical protein [Nitrosomonas sp.]